MHSSQDDSDIVAGRQFNARSIFLQDGLELSYASGDALSVDISLSNYGEGALPAATQLTWSVLLEGKAIKTATAAVTQSVPQGSLGVVGTVRSTACTPHVLSLIHI